MNDHLTNWGLDSNQPLTFLTVVVTVLLPLRHLSLPTLNWGLDEGTVGRG